MKKSEVMGAVAELIDFVKQQIRIDLSEALSQGRIELSKDELKKVCHYAESSVTTSFIKASSQIENAIEKWVNVI